MLTQYLTRTQQLLQNPAAPTTLYSDSDLTTWINVARGQLAGEAECIRRIGTIATVIGQLPYDFADIDIANAVTDGIDGIIHIRRINYAIAAGQRWVTPRPWEWFDFYVLNNPVPQGGPPATWAQYQQGAAPGASGAAAGGTFYINQPDAEYTLNCDCVCYPLALTDDSDPEPIPYLWTDAVPFLATYYALLASQANARLADAERMFNYYTNFVERARRAANPSVLRWQYQGAGDPPQAAKLQLKAPAGGG